MLKKNLELGRVNGLWVKKQKTDKKWKSTQEQITCVNIICEILICGITIKFLKFHSNCVSWHRNIVCMFLTKVLNGLNFHKWNFPKVFICSMYNENIFVVQINWFSFCKSSARTMCERFHQAWYISYEAKIWKSIECLRSYFNTLDLVKNTFPIPHLPIPPGLR